MCVNLQYCGDDSCEAVYDAFLRAHFDLKCSLEEFIEIRTNKSSKTKRLSEFLVYTMPSHLQERLKNQNQDERRWRDAVSQVPLYTDPLPIFDRDFISRARGIWANRVCGNEDVLDIILEHAAEFCVSGSTRPILLVGPPGIGKSLIAEAYAKVLGQPCVSLSAPNEAGSAGLAGYSTVYLGSGPGSLAGALIRTRCGNPVILIDEIDKVSRQNANKANFHSELLSALDDCRTHWKDNFLELELDISHIPFVFTANELDSIPEPLLDRVDIIHMQPLSKETLLTIVTTFSLPDTLSYFSSPLIRVSETAPEALVDKLWSLGARSCRPYLKAVRSVVSHAFLVATEREEVTVISPEDAISAAEMAFNLHPNHHRAIGFA